ncbi:MAG: hypothetical protein SFV15_08730 [Polyangiaceae bacterium]|nr:hypothetical protein [Polyangiaceae bacterium]
MKWAFAVVASGLVAALMLLAGRDDVVTVRRASALVHAAARVVVPPRLLPAREILPGEAEPRRIVQHGRVVSLPTGCVAVAGSYDLVIHFHGAPVALESALEHSGLDSALAIVNLGIGSGVYEQAFAAPGSFGAFVSEVSHTVTKLCPQAREPKRVALSAWSAGYGAVWRIIERSGYDTLIDAVLLADGLHAGFVGPKRERNLDPMKLEPFSTFAELARQGQKLFAMTHTSIATIDYGSTTETSRYLLERAGMEAMAEDIPGPRPEMRLTSQADSGAFHVLGFSGNDKKAHADQLHALGDTLLPYLRERWQK